MIKVTSDCFTKEDGITHCEYHAWDDDYDDSYLWFFILFVLFLIILIPIMMFYLYR